MAKQLPTEEPDPRMGKWDKHVLVLPPIQQGVIIFKHCTFLGESPSPALPSEQRCRVQGSAHCLNLPLLWLPAAAGYRCTKLQVASTGRTPSSRAFMNSVYPRAQPRGGLWQGGKQESWPRTQISQDHQRRCPPTKECWEWILWYSITKIFPNSMRHLTYATRALGELMK